MANASDAVNKSQCQTDKSAYFICILLGWLYRALRFEKPFACKNAIRMTEKREKQQQQQAKNKNTFHTHTHTERESALQIKAKPREKWEICEMRTWTKIDKWRLARLKCQIRTMLRRLFYANSCRAAKVQKEFGGTVEYSGTKSGGIRAVGFLPNNFCCDFFFVFVLLMFWFVRACKCLHSEHLFLYALPFFLSSPAPSYTFGMYTYIYIYFCMYFLPFFVAAHPNFLVRAALFFLEFFVICNNCQQAVLIKMETVQRALSVTDSVVS